MPSDMQSAASADLLMELESLQEIAKTKVAYFEAEWETLTCCLKAAMDKGHGEECHLILEAASHLEMAQGLPERCFDDDERRYLELVLKAWSNAAPTQLYDSQSWRKLYRDALECLGNERYLDKIEILNRAYNLTEQS